MARIVDLSKTIEYNKRDPWFMRIKVKHFSHKRSYWLIRFFLRLPKRLLPKGFTGWADDKIVSMGVHASTHIDAPWHYSPSVNGQAAPKIHEIPLDLCYNAGIVIDVSHKKDFEEITIDDLKADLQKTGAQIKANNIVLIKTGRDKLSGTPDYVKRGTGMSKEATEWLINQGVTIMGIDQWGWDLPLQYMVEQAKKTNDPNYFWRAHLVGQQHVYYHMEQLVNLDALPAFGFKIAVFPLKIKNASAAPVRVVAIFED